MLHLLHLTLVFHWSWHSQICNPQYKKWWIYKLIKMKNRNVIFEIKGIKDQYHLGFLLDIEHLRLHLVGMGTRRKWRLDGEASGESLNQGQRAFTGGNHGLILRSSEFSQACELRVPGMACRQMEKKRKRLEETRERDRRTVRERETEIVCVY